MREGKLFGLGARHYDNRQMSENSQCALYRKIGEIEESRFRSEDLMKSSSGGRLQLPNNAHGDKYHVSGQLANSFIIFNTRHFTIWFFCPLEVIISFLRLGR